MLSKLRAPLRENKHIYPRAPLPTRAGAALDLAFWKGPDIRPTSVYTVDNPVSDHKVLVVEFEGVEVTSVLPPDHPPAPLPDWNRLPLLSLKSQAAEEARAAFVADARRALSISCRAADPVTAMSHSLVEVAVRHFGSKQWRRQHRLPWWNRGLTRLNRKLRRAKAKTSSPSATPADHLAYAGALKTFQAAVQASRRRQARSLALRSKAGDINTAWVLTGRHRNKKTARYLKNVVANPERMTSFWEMYFADSTSPRPTPVAPDPAQPDVFATADVNKAILKMQDKTPGVDGLRVSLLKVVGGDVADLLAKGFSNASRQLIDDQAKTSCLVFLPKRGGCATNPADYRPVALQPVMTKLLEKMIEQQIWVQIDEHQVELSDDHGGFRPHRSRFDLIFLVRCLQEHYHPRGRTRSSRRQHRRLFAAFLDISKAYDSVPHVRIVEVLEQLGVRKELVRLVTDLLTNRYTTIYGKRVGVTRGVPQGSPLSPLLFVLAMMQPLSARMQQHGGGGASLPGGLLLKEGFYADDIFLVAETVEELQEMLNVCDEWALESGLQFNVPKSKVMVLTGDTLSELPELILSNQVLEWTQEFKYLGFPIYAHNNTPSQLPVDLSLLNAVLYPLAPTLLPNGINDFFLCNRVDMLITMVEGKALHNSPMSNICFRDMDAKVNKWLGKIAGLPINTTSATFLRCDLGVLPSQLVAERNALYFLWHLRNETWFKDQLPSMIHLAPLSRLTGLLLDNNITLEEFHKYTNPEKWHDTVKKAVLDRAQHWYDASAHHQRLPNLSFVYRGAPYLREDYTCALAAVAIQARADRLPGVPCAWEYHPCPFCESERGMNGAHLLQCASLPAPLLTARDQLRSTVFPNVSVQAFASSVIECYPSDSVKACLPFADKVFKAARKAVTGAIPTPSPQSDTAGDELNE